MEALPNGWAVRRPSSADADALTAVCAADESQTAGEPMTSHAEVVEMLASPLAPPEDDQWVLDDRAGVPAVWGLVHDGGEAGKLFVDVYRDPARADERHRGWVLDQLLVRSEERRQAAGQDRLTLGAGAFDTDAAYGGTLRSRGFVAERRFHHLRRRLDEPLPVPPTVPGVVVRPFGAANEAEWRAVHALLQRGFAEHWGFSPVSYEAWRRVGDSEVERDLDHWYLAWEGQQLVGATRASGRAHAEGGGWVAELAVLPTARRRGLGRALLLTTFASYAAAGRTWVGLGVDTENHTGAPRLYFDVGMQVVHAIDAYQRVLSPP
jgi:ribosomal protein S18 acetylase RimI-like enzyme